MDSQLLLQDFAMYYINCLIKVALIRNAASSRRSG